MDLYNLIMALQAPDERHKVYKQIFGKKTWGMVMKGRWIAIVSFVVLILSSSGFAQAGLSSGRGVPMPSLSLDLDEERSCALSFVVHITNTGDEEKDDAANVQITVPVIKGASFVDHLEYNPLVGDLQEGQVADVPITIVASPAFYDASLGTEIKVNITVINEDNRADHNTGNISFTPHCAVKDNRVPALRRVLNPSQHLVLLPNHHPYSNP